MVKKKRSVIVVAVVLFVALFTLAIAADYGFAQPAKKSAGEDVPPAKDYTGTFGFIPAFFERGKVNSTISVTEGVDNDVYLDTRRKTSAFTQVLFKTAITSPVTENLKGILGYEVMNLTYENGPADVNLIVNTLRAGTEYTFCKNIKLYTDVKFSGVNYYTTGIDNSLDYSLENRIRQNLPEKMYHSLSHEVMFKDYTTDKIQNGIGVQMVDKRDDIRNTFEYEIGKYLTKDLIKFKLQYYVNDSNWKFLHYYDYCSTRPGFSLIHLFNDKTFSLLSYSAQFRWYDNRTLTLPGRGIETEKDMTQVLTAALYRTVCKDLTVGLSYTYRHNRSNEPTSKYSGSLFSVSAAYNF